MRLKQIKLAGFKSFVEPTKIPFQQQMTAIVGPNGCGKSNVIDAVRWVLGESSAKNLRGDAMTDVIFNGAATRKPVGQASVELVFENTQGRLQGSMADRNEVSIRRVVTRDSVSSYYLNGSKCRRRDITDIFLGTGLGPRSYAIIEQGTISRLIESKPQELRVFIEEAAGVSKYKEKRRDTENRIRHTRDNLERLTDVIVELNSQIDKLHQQAEAAKRFKTLKAQERKYKAELAVLRWQQFEKKRQQSQQKMHAQQLTLESLTVKQHQQDLALLKEKQQLAVHNDKLSQNQQQKLHLSNNIIRLEQTIKHTKQQRFEAKNQLSQLEKALADNVEFQQQEQLKLVDVENSLSQNLPKLEQIEQKLEQSQFNLLEQQEALQRCFQQWEQANQCANEQHQQVTNFDAKMIAQHQLITQSQQLVKQAKDRLIELESSCQSADLVMLASDIDEYKQQLKTLLLQQTDLQSDIIKTQQTQQHQQQRLATAQAQKQTLATLLTPLQQRDNQVPDWYQQQVEWRKQQNLSSYGRVYQQLTVAPQWQYSVELVLTQWLSAELVDSFPQDVKDSNLLPERLLFIKSNAENVEVKANTLAAQVSGNALFIQWLNKIFIAENILQAQQLLVELNDDESVICCDGTWLSHYFFRKGAVDSSEDLLQRKSQINDFTEQIEKLSDNINELELHLNAQQKINELLKTKQQGLNKAISSLNNSLQKKEQDAALTQQAQQHIQQQIVQVQQRICQYNTQLEQQEHVYNKLEQQYEHALAQQAQNNQHSLAELTRQREHMQQDIKSLQAMVQQFQQQHHQISLLVVKGKITKENIEQKIQQATIKNHQLQQNLTQLNLAQQEKNTPLADDEKCLQDWLTQMSQLEGKLSLNQKNVTLAQTKIEQLSDEKTSLFTEIDQSKERVNQYHLDTENYRLRGETVLEQLNEMQQELTQVLANMPSEAKETHWQAQIARLAKDIASLGAINLAAIDEYSSELTRKNFLDQQHQDLTLAITTLESAIAKIDKQSRHKFKITFDQINNDLKRLFPRVFGGGNAYLALTGDDLLETGVTIMARPPGKKNSTIHLLSGGEKALTALSLVFAIFRLNPAPFCMLDEVDAPLDDANVVRFCNLVKEMSQTVQFIYISHNKIAMEMATHLTGVTMFEAGVSRMVTVDIDEAIAMAEVE